MRSPALLPSSLTNDVTATAAFGQLACAVGSLADSDLNDALASLPIASISLSFGPLNGQLTAASALLGASDCILVVNERVHVSTSLQGSAAAMELVAIRARRIVRISVSFVWEVGPSQRQASSRLRARRFVHAAPSPARATRRPRHGGGAHRRQAGHPRRDRGSLPCRAGAGAH